jgi:hypothetical protein
MIIPSNRSGSFPQSQTQTYEWRTFLLEFLYGLLTIVWLFLALAEISAFKGLTRLEKLALSLSDEPSENSGRSAPFDESESSIGLQSIEIHASCYEFESARLDKSQYAHRRSASQHHISWILILAGLVGMTFPHCQSQAIYGSNRGPVADVQGIHGRQSISWH